MEEGIKPIETITKLQEIITGAGQHTQCAPAPLGLRGEADQLIQDLNTAAKGLGERINPEVFRQLASFEWMMSGLLGVPSIPPTNISMSPADRQAMMGTAEYLKRFFHEANQNRG